MCKRNCRQQPHVTRNRNNLICVSSPKVAKTSIMVTVLCRCRQHYCKHYRSKLCQCKYGLKKAHWRNFILSFLDNYYHCLCHLGWCDKDKNDPICVVPPRGAKTSIVVIVACRCWQHLGLDICQFIVNKKNLNDPLNTRIDWFIWVIMKIALTP